MAVPWIVVVCRGALVCLPPLGVFLATVGRRHRSERPVVVSGVADFLMLLAGLSGFLLAGFVVLLAAVQSDARLVGRGDFAQIQAAWSQGRTVWGLVAVGYVGLMGMLVWASISVRRRTLSVFNADPTGLDRAITDALAAAGVPAERFGDGWAADRPLASVDHTPMLGHATVRVTATDSRLNEEIRRQLAAKLPQAPPARGGAGSGFQTAAGVCFGGAAAGLGLLMVYEWLMLS